MPQISKKDELLYEREYAFEMIQFAFLGAFYSAIQSRKALEGLSQKELAERSGKDKTAISKLLSGPSNWTLRTISDLSVALKVDFDFTLRDQQEPSAYFNASGKHHDVVKKSNYPNIIEAIPMKVDQIDNAVNQSINNYTPNAVNNFNETSYITNSIMTQSSYHSQIENGQP